MNEANTSYRSIWHFIGAFLVTAFMVAAGTATIITFVWQGLPILQHGIPMCKTLMDANMEDRILYTSCGCALVELILVPLAIMTLWVFFPKLIQQFKYVRSRRSKS